MYLCMCFLKTPDWFHACFGCTAEEHTQQFVLAPLCRFAVVENWSKSKVIVMLFGRGWGLPLSRTRCKGPAGSWA